MDKIYIVLLLALLVLPSISASTSDFSIDSNTLIYKDFQITLVQDTPEIQNSILSTQQTQFNGGLKMGGLEQVQPTILDGTDYSWQVNDDNTFKPLVDVSSGLSNITYFVNQYKISNAELDFSKFISDYNLNEIIEPVYYNSILGQIVYSLENLVGLDKNPIGYNLIFSCQEDNPNCITDFGTPGIIVITDAEHLDSDKNLISDIYDWVKIKDNNWSETINDGEYVRVTFEKNLTSENDISVYARSTTENPSSIEVYKKDSDELVMTISNITTEELRKTLLTEMSGESDTFDLKIIGSMDFDYIVDPTVENIATCRPLNVSGTTYNLTADVTNAGTCFTVTADSVTLVGNYKKVTGDIVASGSGTTGGNGNPAYTNLAISNITVVGKVVADGVSVGSSSLKGGGAGGNINITNANITGILTAKGGNGDTEDGPDVAYYGGIGGNIIVTNSTVTSISTTGGDGNAGSGGSVTLANSTATTITTTAGYAGWGSNAGTGGAVTLTSSNATGTITANGGDGSLSYGGNGGAFTITSSNVANLTSNGGPGVAEVGGPGHGGSMTITGSTFGSISSTGGSGGPYGDGSGGNVTAITSQANLAGLVINLAKGSSGSAGTLKLNQTSLFNVNGTIKFTYVSTTSTALNSAMWIRNNSAYINTSYASGNYNSSANVTLNGLKTNYANPAILKNGNIICTSKTTPACYNFTSLNAGTVVFNVTAWSNYSIGESPISIIKNTQIPADITSLNAVSTGANITYNISHGNPLNLSTILIYYKTNSTTSNSIIFVNGTAEPEWGNDTYTSNTSDTFLWNIQDNEIYPATYNLDDDVTDVNVHTQTAMSTTSNYVAIQLLNVTNSTTYNFFEIMSNSTSIQDLYYCNSSYDFSSSPATSANCILFNTIPANQPYNHTHTSNSKHQVAVLTINSTTGKVGTIKITPTSYFLLRGNNGAGNQVNYYSVTNTSRTGAIRTTNNNGNTWTNQTYTIDAHLHQFSNTTSLYYYACANDTISGVCSSVSQDLLELAGLPPQQGIITAPVSGNYIDGINVNYTAWQSPNGYPIASYNISLMNTSYSFNKTLISNNYPNLGYIFNSSSVPNGNYIIRVIGCDNQSQCSTAYSQSFSTANFAGGNGTSISPYQIGSWATLNSMRFNMSAYYILTSNLTSLDSDYVGIGDDWIPVGNDSAQFLGNFNGQNNIISDIKIHPLTSKTGLFGYAINATIKNIGMINVNITDSQYVGGIAGYVDGVLIDNCYVTGNLTAIGEINGTSYVGGIAGLNGFRSNITNSYSSVNVYSSGTRAGGIAGHQTATSITNNCYATGNITGVSDDVGGLIGRAGGIVNNSYATGKVTGSANNVGGLIGWQESTNRLSNSYATGNINGTSYVGGIVGYQEGGSQSTNTNASGNVSGNAEVGGLVGEMDCYLNTCSLSNSHSTSNTISGDFVGGLVGYASGYAQITNSYSLVKNMNINFYGGGLVGWTDTGVIVSDSYVIVNGTWNAGSTDWVGTLVGDMAGPEDTLSNSYAIVEAGSVITGRNHIGMVGEDNGGNTITNSYLTFRDLSLGNNVTFTSLVTGGTDTITSAIQIGNNSAYVNSTKEPSLNKSANITFNLAGWNIVNPRVLKDGVLCPAPLCNILSWDYGSKIIKFNVTSWSNYTIDDNHTAPVLTLTSPINTTYLSTQVPFIANCSANYGATTMFYSIDGATNVTITSPNTLYTLGYEVYHNFTLWCNDSVGNRADSNVTFYVGLEAVGTSCPAPNSTGSWSSIGFYANGSMICNFTAYSAGQNGLNGTNGTNGNGYYINTSISGNCVNYFGWAINSTGSYSLNSTWQICNGTAGQNGTNGQNGSSGLNGTNGYGYYVNSSISGVCIDYFGWIISPSGNYALNNTWIICNGLNGQNGTIRYKPYCPKGGIYCDCSIYGSC